MWTANKDTPMHLIVDVEDGVQIIAVSMTEAKALDERVAAAAIPMLFVCGHVLQEMLLTHGLLEKVEEKLPSGRLSRTRIVTKIAAVNAFFNNICYVCVSKVAKFPFPACRDPRCTCPIFGRYGDCEHAEYTRMMDLRLRSATSFPESVPLQRKRGRKPGKKLTATGRARCGQKRAPRRAQKKTRKPSSKQKTT